MIKRARPQSRGTRGKIDATDITLIKYQGKKCTDQSFLPRENSHRRRRRRRPPAPSSPSTDVVKLLPWSHLNLYPLSSANKSTNTVSFPLPPSLSLEDYKAK